MFARVRAVNLTLRREQTELSVSELFPDAERVEIQVTAPERCWQAPPRLALSISRLTLRSLTFDNSAGHDLSLSLDGMRRLEVAEVSYTSPSLDGGFPDGFCPEDPVHVEFLAFVARAEGARHTDYGPFDSRRPEVLTITVSTPDGTWRCTLRVPFDVAERTALPEPAALPCNRLTALVVSESVVGYLLHTEVALPALRSLHAVECVVWNGSVSVRGRCIDLCELRAPAQQQYLVALECGT